jgi:redox-sensitive bicupin YhaK (pirin superfamily)
MIYIRQNSDRGQSQTDWLTSFHTFSFADYYEPQFMGFSTLRVINEDTVKANFGFGRHPHNNMEIISYVIEGALEHRDSMGTGSVIQAGEIQIMSAGTGVEHSEFNHSKTAPLHFLQIWIIPEKKNIAPSYQQIKIHKTDNRLILLGSNHENENVIKIHQEVNLYAAYMTSNHEIDHTLSSGRAAWLQLIKGQIQLNNHDISAGDGAAIQNENIKIRCNKDAEFLLFDLLHVKL